jgi:type I restriction enzyme S subunit
LVPLLRANNIADDRLTYDDLIYVPSKYVSEKQHLRKNDVVIAASSGSLASVGKTGAVEDDSFAGTFGAFCKVLRPKQQKVDPRYFAHFFRTADYRRTISALAAGANINNLKNEHLNDLVIPLPPLEEQRRIAAILDKADALRQTRHRAVALLDGLTQSIFFEMFGPAIANLQKIKHLALADMIAGGDRLNYGVVQPGDHVDGGVPIVRVSDLSHGRVAHSDLKLISPTISAGYQRSVLNGSEILVSCVGSVGEVALASEKEKGFNIARAVARIPLDRRYSRIYVAEFLRTDHVRRYFTKELRTVSQPTLNIKQLSQTLVPIPSASETTSFEQRVAAVDTMREHQVTAIGTQTSLFASLQHRAFSGQL